MRLTDPTGRAEELEKEYRAEANKLAKQIKSSRNHISKLNRESNIASKK